MSALQYLPYPIIILNGMKTLVMANDAIGRLLSIDHTLDHSSSDDDDSLSDKLQGKTLSQLGIDMLQDGRPVWVKWESFMDGLVDAAGRKSQNDQKKLESESGDATPTAGRIESSDHCPDDPETKPTVHDAVVEVLISSSEIPASYFANGLVKDEGARHTFAKMIITAWKIDDENYFTLTFTNTDSSQISFSSGRGQSRSVKKATRSKQQSLGASSHGSTSHSNPSPVSSGNGSTPSGSSNASAVTSPTSAILSASPFPPLGPPSRSNTHFINTPSSLQKVIMMKDALLDNTKVPILAMWKDESLAIPNKAARKLFSPTADFTTIKDGFDLVSRWGVWDETFTTRLDPSEYPISVLVRSQKPFSGRRVGMIDPDTGRKIVMDCLGETLKDESTGEFLAGVLTCRDITAMTEQISEIREKDDQRFQLICDSMPQMIWTTTPDGMHDWFSERW